MADDPFSQIYKDLNAEITATIDNDIICKIFESQGWTRVYINCTDEENYNTILDWMDKNISTKWYGRYDNWVFESNDDALMFKLVWSDGPN